MRLSELAKPTEHKLLGQDVEVGELQYNSRKVKAGDVFCCIVGTFADGHAYAAQAVEQGAAAGTQAPSASIPPVLTTSWPVCPLIRSTLTLPTPSWLR